jgi:iron complex outermembrane receptor protein
MSGPSLNRLNTISWVLLAAAATCPIAYAQTSNPDDQEDKPDAATAKTSGRVEPLQEVVILGQGAVRSTQTLSADVIQQQPPLTNPMSLIDRLPGVNSGNADPFGNDDWSTDLDIRGFDRDRLGFSIDGLPLGSSSYRVGSRPDRFTDNENLQSVTVLQGASATGAGSSQALGGSIQYVTRGPQPEFGGKFSYSGGDYQLRRYFARIDSGPILGDRTFAYVSYSNSSNNHWMDYGAHAKNTRKHTEIALLQKLGEANSLELKYVHNNRFGNNYNRVTRDYWEQNHWNDGIHGPWTGNPRIDANNAEGWIDPEKDDVFSLRGDFALPAGIALTFTGYRHTTVGPGTWPWECVFQPTSFTAPTPGPTVCDRDENGVATLSTMYISRYAFHRDGMTLGLSKAIGRHTLAVGAWFEVKHREQSRTYNELLDPKTGPAWGDPYYLEADGFYYTRTKTAYIQDTISLLNDRLTVNAGVSALGVNLWYYDTRDTKGKNTYDSGYTFAPRAGASYKVSDGVEVFGSYTKNYKALQDSQLRGRDVSNVNTETANSFDLGLRYKNHWLNTSLTVYKINFDNRIVDFNFTLPPEVQGSRSFSPDGIQINAGSTQSSGVELAAQIRFLEGFEWYMSAAKNKTDSVVVRSIQTDERGQLVSVNWISAKRTDLPFFGELSYSRGRFRAAMNADYVDFREGNFAGSRGAPAYWLAGMHASYAMGLRRAGPIDSLALNVSVSNLFNKPYLSGVAQDGRFYVGSPRTLVFSASTDF